MGTSTLFFNAPTTSTFAQFGFGVVVMYPYVLDLGSTSIGPNDPIPIAARFLNFAKNSAVFFKVSCGVVVGNCSSSTVLNYSSATAQINFVPPASKLPYKFVIGLKLP